MNSFRITNFRVFDNTGTKVDFSPITILTGSNSSGKSSFVKAMVLLKDWLDGIRNEYKKDGSFMPASHPMDFSRSDLKLKGFKGTMNRGALEDAKMTFSLGIDLGTLLGKYTIEYSFIPNEGLLDMGILDSIRILQDDEECFLACRQGETFKTVVFRGLLKRFVIFETLYLIPKRLLRDFVNPETGEYEDIWSEEGIDDKLYSTKQSSRLFEIQKAFFSGLERPIWEWAVLTSGTPEQDNIKYPNLFDKDMTIQFETYAQTKTFFYFPVLDKLKDVDKAESIRILKESVPTCKRLSYFGINQAPNLDKVISAYTASNIESFIAFYEEQEDNFFREFNSPLGIQTIGKSENFIDTDILQGIDLKYDYYGLFRSESLFTVIYKALSYWQWAEDEATDATWTQENLYREASEYPEYFCSGHRLYRAYSEFVSYVMKMVLMPDSLSRMAYFNSSFTSVQRLYSFEESAMMVSTVKSYLNAKDKFNKSKQNKWRTSKLNEYTPGTFICKWLKEFGIGEELVVKVEEEGLGFRLYIKKADYEEALADMGHGVSQIVSLLLLIESSILDSKIKKAQIREQMEGHLPYDSVPPAILAIEEPEVSMHPNFQSKLACLFEDVVHNYHVDVRFIIETHSEYMVRRTQAYVAHLKTDEEFDKNPFVVYYFNNDGTAYDLEYMRSGRFANSFGTGFFDEAGKSSIEILRREKEDRK